MFRSVLVANRGEIAVRIFRTLAYLGIRAVATYTEADRGALHVALADVAVPVDSYLSVESVIGAAKRSGAEAVHPGYGFLAENPALALAVIESGLAWVGPPPAAIELMGDKIAAKHAVGGAGVPVVPGVDGRGASDEQLGAAVTALGFPLLIKPSAGGGGKGMRRVDGPESLAAEIAAARREAAGAFGDDTLLVERFVTRPRHIEVQVFADRLGAFLHMGERECSLQRRHQKIVEEAPSPLLDADTRVRMCDSALRAARACGYAGAGTVEFIVSGEPPHEHFFMEMNTRLQVEHPVTEAITGIDLVEWQLRVAADEPLPLTQEDIRFDGHAVEARLYAEDAARGFLPATGEVVLLSEPAGRAGVRVDSALRAGTVVGTSYDPMLAKVIAWAPDRRSALRRLDAALAETSILGVTTNVGFLRRLLADPAVQEGRLDTELVERLDLGDSDAMAEHEVLVAAALVLSLGPAAGAPVRDPWDLPGAWRVGGPAETEHAVIVGGRSLTLGVTGHPVDAVVRVGERQPEAASARLDGGRLAVTAGGVTSRWAWAWSGQDLWLGRDGSAWKVSPDLAASGELPPSEAAAGGPVRSPMPGTVLAVYVAAGQHVRAGQPIAAVEAMKMEHTVSSPSGGTVSSVKVVVGQSVSLDETLAVVTSGDGA